MARSKRVPTIPPEWRQPYLIYARGWPRFYDMPIALMDQYEEAVKAERALRKQIDAAIATQKGLTPIELFPDSWNAIMAETLKDPAISWTEASRRVGVDADAVFNSRFPQCLASRVP